MNHNPGTDHPAWDDTDRRIAANLDLLADAEARSAPRDFERRVAERTARALRSRPMPIVRILTPLSVRIAAVVALVLGGLVLVLSLRPHAAPMPAPHATHAPPASDLDSAVAEWLTLAALGGQDAIAAELDLLYAETARLGEISDWSPVPDPDYHRGSM
jgi:hypothetical protein